MFSARRKQNWNFLQKVLANVIARGFIFFGSLVFQNYILTAYSTSKDT